MWNPKGTHIPLLNILPSSRPKIKCFSKRKAPCQNQTKAKTALLFNTETITDSKYIALWPVQFAFKIVISISFTVMHKNLISGFDLNTTQRWPPRSKSIEHLTHVTQTSEHYIPHLHLSNQNPQSHTLVMYLPMINLQHINFLLASSGLRHLAKTQWGNKIITFLLSQKYHFQKKLIK